MQEVAFTFANAIAYVEAAVAPGLDVDRFAQRLSFFFNAHNDFLEEIAKFRAARRLWAQIMRDRFGATNPRAQQLRFHTQTAGSTLTAQQPDNNIVRVALQALAAVLGGTQSLHSNGRDEALALPTEESARVALRTQQIIAWSAAWPTPSTRSAARIAIEALTDEIERDARELIARIDRLGGTLAAIEIGLDPARDPGRRVPGAAAVDAGERRRRRRQPLRRRPEGAATSRRSARSTRQDRARGRSRRRAGERARQLRDARAMARPRLDAVSAAARGTDNLVPPISRAVEAHATLGEISDAMRAVFGEHKEIDA